MNQEFVTLYGKAIIERNILYLRSPYLPFSKTPFVRIGLLALVVLIFILQFARDREPPRLYVGIILWGVVLASRLPKMYDVFFRRSYASRIPLDRIESFTITDDAIGLQTTVRLQLKNGRYKKIIFRKLENQAEAFTEVLSPYVAKLANI